MIKLNETPVRTARNFNINNIKLENIDIRRRLKPFQSAEVFLESSKDVALREIYDIALEYGICDLLTEQASNYELTVNINSKMKNTVMVDFKFDKENDYLVDKIFIDAKPDTKSNVIIKYTSKDALFLSKRKERISNRMVQEIVKRELGRAGLDMNKYSVHKLRHTAATLMYQIRKSRY